MGGGEGAEGVEGWRVRRRRQGDKETRAGKERWRTGWEVRDGENNTDKHPKGNKRGIKAR